MHSDLRSQALALALAIIPFTAASGQTVDASATPAATAAEPDTTDRLQEVIVTAQRRAERAQDVPISISVVSGEALAESGFHSLTDVQHLVPSVQYEADNGGSFQIRGVGTQAWDFSTEQAVSVVVDDVVQDLPRNPGLNSLTDIQRIEVLRGPQGIQFGRNATAGVISVTTTRPQLNKLSADMTVEYGERSDQKFAGNLNVPIGAMAALRLTGFYQGQDGLGSYVALGENLGKFADYGTRLKLLVQPTQQINFLLTADASVHHDNNCYVALSAVDPAVAASLTAHGVSAGPNNLNSASGTECVMDYRNQGLSLAANWDLGGPSLVAITAYRKLEYADNEPLEADLVTRVLIPLNKNVVDAHKLSEEVRLTSPAGGLLTYVAGLYFNRLIADASQDAALSLPPDAPGALPPGLYLFPTAPAGPPGPPTTGALSVHSTQAQSIAAFSTATLKPTDRFELVFGGRVTHDRSSQKFGYEPTNSGYLGFGVGNVPSPASGAQSATNFSYRIAPTFRLTDDAIAFATYSTGYKAPGVAFVSGIYAPYRRETVKNYEVGLKSELLDRRLRLNATAFYEDFKDFQAQAQDPQNVTQFIVLNAGGMRSKGVETELDWRATRALTLNAGVTYADSTFTNFLYQQGVQLAGLPLTNAPKWSATAGANLSMPLTPKLLVDANVGYSWRSWAFLKLNDPISRQDAYGLLQARVGVGPDDGRWRVGVYGRNLTNRYFLTISSDLGPFRAGQSTPEAGRTVGGFLNVRF